MLSLWTAKAAYAVAAHRTGPGVLRFVSHHTRAHTPNNNAMAIAICPSTACIFFGRLARMGRYECSSRAFSSSSGMFQSRFTQERCM